jgi:hypothetical protein
VKPDAEAQRDHRRLVQHTIQAATEQFRSARAAEQDDSIIKVCTCGGRFIGRRCPYCGAFT